MRAPTSVSGESSVLGLPSAFWACERRSPLRGRHHGHRRQGHRGCHIAEQFKDSTWTLVTEYRGLTVANLKDLRRSLGCDSATSRSPRHVVKVAAEEAGIEGPRRVFVGPTAIRVRQGRGRRSREGDQERSPRTTRRSSIKGAKNGRPTAERFRGRKRSPTWSRVRFCWPSWPGADEGQSVQGRRRFNAPRRSFARLAGSNGFTRKEGQREREAE